MGILKELRDVARQEINARYTDQRSDGDTERHPLVTP